MASINIKATHTALSQSVEDYVAKKINSFSKYLDESSNVHVELEQGKDKSGQKYRAEITVIPHSSHKGIYADARGNDFYEAIDLCMPKIKEQVMKQKDRWVTERRKLGAKRKGNM
jgi:ribosomal subunit interface protein